MNLPASRVRLGGLRIQLDGAAEVLHRLVVPAEEVAFVKQYARQHGLTVTEVLYRYLQRLRAAGEESIYPEVEKLFGLLPPDLDAKLDYYRHVQEKHR